MPCSNKHGVNCGDDLPVLEQTDDVDASFENNNYATDAVFCPGFQKGRVPSQKGTFSAVKGLSKWHFSAVNGLSKGHFSAVNGPSKGHFSAVKGRIGALLTR